jgi:hypothetical protein
MKYFIFSQIDLIMPSEILLIENFSLSYAKGTHLCISIDKYALDLDIFSINRDHGYFFVEKKNGSNIDFKSFFYIRRLLNEFKNKYIECSLEKFNDLKIFL